MTYDMDFQKGWEQPPTVRDVEVERVQQAAEKVKSLKTPLPATPAKKALPKKEKQALRNKTAGPAWCDLPAPAPADLPRLQKEVEALRLHSQIDPKRFYRKDEGEGKGIKGLAKHFAVRIIIIVNYFLAIFFPACPAVL